MNHDPKTNFGARKPPVALVPPVAIIHEAMAMADGARKYGAYSWRAASVSTMTYLNAALRHLFDYVDGTVQSDTNVHNLGHARACLAIILDAEANGTLVDDRPLPGKSATVQEAMVERVPSASGQVGSENAHPKTIRPRSRSARVVRKGALAAKPGPKATRAR